MATDEYSYDQLQAPNTGAFNVGKQLANGVRSAYCDLYRRFPWAYNGAFDQVGQFNKGFNDTICNDFNPPPDPSPPITGGQCVGANYTLTTTVHYEFFFNGVSQGTQTQTGNQGVSGAIKDLHYYVDGSKVYASFLEAVGTPQFPDGARQTFQILDQQPLDPRVYNRFISAEFSVVRNGGLPDDCGDPAPDWIDRTPIPPSLLDDINVNVNITPTLIVPVSVKITNVNITNNLRPTVIVKNPSIQFSFGNNGVSSSYPGGGGSVAVDLSPVLDGITTLAVNQANLSGAIGRVEAKQLKLSPITLSTPKCGANGIENNQVDAFVLDDGNGKTEAELFNNIYQQLFRLRSEGKLQCATTNVPETILVYVANTPGIVEFTPVRQPGTLGYIVEVMEYDPTTVRTYKLAGDDSEVGFGNAALTSSNDYVIGERVNLFTQKTFIPAWDITFPHRVRVSVKQGCSVRVIDLGQTLLN